MNNKFENKNEEEKLFKKSPLLDRTLHKNTGPNLCFSIIYQKPCIRLHISFLIIYLKLG